MGSNVIKSVSMDKVLADFLDENSELSLSKIVQERIKEIINIRATAKAEVVRLNRVREYLSEKLMDVNEFISYKNLDNEFKLWLRNKK